MLWPLLIFTALVLAAWIGLVVWLVRGFRRGQLLDKVEPERTAPRSDFRA